MTTDERLELLHRVATTGADREHQAFSSTDAGGCDQASALAFGTEVPVLAEALEPAEPWEVASSGVLHLVELILKRRGRLEEIVRDRSLQSVLLPIDPCAAK